MTKTQAAGVALFLWLIAIIELTNSDATLVDRAIFLVLFLVAYGLITWEEKK